MTTAERLVVRLRAELGSERVPEGATAVRTHPSRSARVDGAWSWFLMVDGGELFVGSQWPMARMLRCQRWRIDTPASEPLGRRDNLDQDIHIDPCPSCRRSETWVCAPKR